MSRKRDEDVRILYIANNPVAAKHPLGLEREAEVIREELQRGGAAAAYPLHALTTASTDDLHEALLFAPRTQVLHLAGHGHATKGILTTDGEGHRVAMRGERLAQVLTRNAGIRLVILGACSQLTQADPLKELVPCVIATADTIPDNVAINFSRALYKELAAGSTVGDAYEMARGFAGLADHEGAQVLRLAHRESINPRWIELDPVERPTPTHVVEAADRKTQIAAQDVINGIDDVILTANTPGWQHIVPHDKRADPIVVSIDIGADGWQRTFPPDPAAWRKGADAVRDGVRRIKASKRRRVHIAAKMPYELGALLASELEQQNREVVFYQETPLRGAETPRDHRTWQPWGPGLVTARPKQQQVAVFEAPLRPNDTYEHPCDVAILVSVSQYIAPALARAAIEAPQAEIQTVQLVPHAEIGPDAIDAFNIDKASDELTAEIEGTPRRFPALRAIHLFYSGPLALLMRAAGRLRVQSTPVYLYSYFPRAPSDPRYVRMFELGARRLMLPGAE